MIATASRNAGIMIAVTFDDGRPPCQMLESAPELAAWVQNGGSISSYTPPPADLLPYQAARKAAYLDLDVALDKRPDGAAASAENTAGHVTDATLTMLETIRVAAGVPATPEWSALITAVTAIKVANPKPS